MNSVNQEYIDRGEGVYTARVDSVQAFSGINKVQFVWWIKSDPRITKTEISWYQGNDKIVREISLNRTQNGNEMKTLLENIPEGTYYFEFVTTDDEGSRSVSLGKTVEIYGQRYAETLPSRSLSTLGATISNDRVLTLNWVNLVNWDIISTKVRYTDRSDPAHPRLDSVIVDNYSMQTVLPGKIALEPYSIASTFKLSGGIDTIEAVAKLYYPPVDEASMLSANGIVTYSVEAANAITSLNYPLYVSSFKDLIYFPNVTELDLTGISYPLLTTTYSRSGYSMTVGGGDWVPFMRKFNAVSTANAQVLLNLLASGQVTNVKYVPHSLGIDGSLAPYITSGVVELIDLPNEVLVPHKFFMETYMQDANFLADIVFPSASYPAGTGLQNVYKLTVIGKKSALIFNIPLRYQLNIEEYKYFKFKMYAPPESAFDGEYNGSLYSPYKRLRMRVMNFLWSMDSGLYGEGDNQNYWDSSIITLDATNYEQWVDVTLDFSTRTANRDKAFYFDIGCEAFGQDYVEETKRDLVFYFANIRFSKNP
jgi:hypothetical protein